MSTPKYNLTAVRKTIGAIHHRMHEDKLDVAIKRRIILRQLQDLADTLPQRKFGRIVGRTIQAHNERDDLELVAGLSLLESMLPPMTYGCVLQGQVFEVEGRGMFRKNKAGRVEIMSGSILPHFPADTIVKLVNE
jgi:hypothetical protein